MSGGVLGSAERRHGDEPRRLSKRCRHISLGHPMVGRQTAGHASPENRKRQGSSFLSKRAFYSLLVGAAIYDVTVAKNAERGRHRLMVDQDAGRDPKGEAADHGSLLTVARRGAAVALLLGWLVVLWISFQTPYLHTCDDQVARVGSAALATSCKPLSISDAPTLALLVAACVLLLPDLSAVEIPGLFRLERQLKEQDVRQQERQAEIVGMINRLEVNQSVYNVFDIARLAELVGLQNEKRQRFDTDAS